MATIEKRVSSEGITSFRAKVRMRGHAPVSKTFDRKTDATRWAAELERRIKRGEGSSSEADSTTLKEALERYEREETPRKKGSKREVNRILVWKKDPLAHRFLSQIRGVDLAAYRDGRRKEGKAENTIRLELALISKLFKVASTDWGMEGLRNPIKGMRMPSGSNARERRLQPIEESALLLALEAGDPYMRPLAELAIETAMRQGELLTLTWGAVDLQKQVAYLADTKNNEPRAVPLSRRAVEIVKTLPRAIGPLSRLFPIGQDYVGRCFRAACKLAGLVNLRFHDLRHEATSRICDLLPMHEAMRITGHKTPSMLMRYYHPKAEDLAKKLG